jgi:protein-export membrane protein SecD
MYKKTAWGFTFLALFIALCIWLLYTVPIQLGIDLQGGTRLVYRLDLSRVADNPSEVVQDVKDIITKRLNAFGLKDLSISTQGEDRLEVQLPGADRESVRIIMEQIERAGTLTFHLVMTAKEHTSEAKMDQYVEQEKAYNGQLVEYARLKRDWTQRKTLAEKAGETFTEPAPDRPEPPEFIVRWAGEYVEKEDEPGKWEFVPRKRGRRVLGNREDLKVDGRFLSYVGRTTDQSLNPAIGFGFGREGASRFGDLTGGHIGEPLAIVLDDDIMQIANIKSRISTSGILEGKFTNQEVTGIVTVLRGGSLPTKPQLEGQSTVGSLFGQASINSGVYSVVIGLAVVMFCIAG